MSRYAVAPETREARPLMVLRDSAGPASARSWPAKYNNCLARWPRMDGAWR